LFLADKAYDADERVLKLLDDAGVETLIPPKSNRKNLRKYDTERYKARHLIEISLGNSSSTGPLRPGMTKQPAISGGHSSCCLGYLA